MTSRLDRLRVRQLPSEDVPLPADPQAYAAATTAVEDAVRAMLAAQARGVTDLDEYTAAIEQAQAALDAVPAEVFTVNALPPAEWDALIDQHPPTDEQRAQGWQWDPAGFRPAALAACVAAVDGEDPLTARHWAEFAEEGRLTAGELTRLFAAAVTVNARQPQVNTGKGSAQTPS